MKKLRIGILLMALVLTGAWLSATESIVPENEQQELTLKTAQADTVRMTWVVENSSPVKGFFFKGENGATYKVEWGDGETETYNGANYQVSCSHRYSTKGTYTVLLYGVASEEK
ncbi:MAG: PKD domain-containing protein [Bacteroides sp.]|nr:PKD domain-containing protein [Bacteroides sp.]